MKLEIEVTSKMMQQLTPVPFSLLIFYYAYYTKNKKLPSKKEAAKVLKISLPTLNSNLKTIVKSKVSNDTSSYKEMLDLLNLKNKNLYNKEGKKVESRRDIEEYWNYVNKLAKKYYVTHKKIVYYFRIRIYIYELIKKIGKENIKDYAKWWFEEKVSKIRRFGAGIFFYGGIMEEYLDWRKLEDKKNISKKEDVFHQQVLEEQRQYAVYCLEKKREGKKLEKWEIELVEQAKKDRRKVDE